MVGGVHPESAVVSVVGPVPCEVLAAARAVVLPATPTVCRTAEEVDPASTLVVIWSSDPASTSATVSRCTGPGTRIVVVTDNPDENEAVLAMKAGAIGYVVLGRDRRGTALLALRRALLGRSYVSSVVLDRLLHRLRHSPEPAVQPSSTYALSTQERQILIMLAGGMTNHRVGRRLSISEGTVRNRLAGIYAKLQVERRSEAIAKWSRLHHGEPSATELPSSDQPSSDQPLDDQPLSRMRPTSGEPRLDDASPESTQAGASASAATAEMSSRSAPMRRSPRTGSAPERGPSSTGLAGGR